MCTIMKSAKNIYFLFIKYVIIKLKTNVMNIVVSDHLLGDAPKALTIPKNMRSGQHHFITKKIAYPKNPRFPSIHHIVNF